MKRQCCCRGLIYLCGLVLLALGISLNTKTQLGVSPIILVSYSISTILNLNFGNTTLVQYTIFILIEILLHLLKGRKKQVLFDALQFPLSLPCRRQLFANSHSFLIIALFANRMSVFHFRLC